MPTATDQARWQAVCARDRAADGSFVYSVQSTGVFCRPSCPSRRAKREHVRFHATPEAAQAAGFRPCLRCRPLADVSAAAASRSMVRIARHIEAHVEEPLPLATLAQLAGQSPFHVQRAFKATFGITPKQYQRALRLRRFKRNLRKGRGVLDATFEAGFGSTSRIYEQLDRELGMPPRAYQSGGAGERIDYVVRDTRFGPLLMAATERGVCFVQFGEDASSLRAALEREYPRAELQPSRADQAPELEAWMRALAAHLEEHAPQPHLPLDLRGSAFQIRVWRFLAQTKPGEVLTYTELARRIGAPAAIRAAGSACAKNRIALLVPCHRVLRSDGGLGGYRWGEARKRALLESEREHAAKPSKKQRT